MKMKYENTEMEIVKFSAEDVIATSGATDGGLINGGAGAGDDYDFETMLDME